jgi:AraC-like DNA-binding protein
MATRSLYNVGSERPSLGVHGHILAYLPDVRAQAAVRSDSALRKCVRICPHERDLLRHANEDRISAIVWTMHAANAGDFHELQRIRDLGATWRLLLRFEITPAAMWQLASIAAGSHEASLVLTDEAICPAIGILSDPTTHPTSDLALLRRWLPRGEDLELLVAATLLGKRRVGVRDLTAASRMSMATLRKRLQRARLPGPRDLLGKMLVLHAAWRLGVQQWSIKRTASSLGFRSTQAFSNFVRRYTGVAPQTLGQHPNFDDLVLQTLAHTEGHERVVTS